MGDCLTKHWCQGRKNLKDNKNWKERYAYCRSKIMFIKTSKVTKMISHGFDVFWWSLTVHQHTQLLLQTIKVWYIYDAQWDNIGRRMVGGGGGIATVLDVQSYGFAPWQDIVLSQTLIYYWREIFLLTLILDSGAIL